MPALTPVVDSLDKVPEPLRTYYEQKEGKYHVILDGSPIGFVAAADHAIQLGKVVEFRDKNVALLQEIEPLRKLKTDVGDLDIPKAKTAVVELDAIKAKGISKPDDVAAQIQAAVTAAIKPLEERQKASDTTIAAERKRADEQTLARHVGEKFTKVGGIPSALDYIVGKAGSVFKVDSGAVVAQPNMFSSDKPGDPLTVEEWLVKQTKESDFAFKPSGGGGAEGNKGAGGGSGLKPGQSELRNPSPQQLGEHMSDIKSGKMKVVYDQQIPA